MRKLKMMNTISIVVDSEVLSKWKFDFISRLCEKVQVREFIILCSPARLEFGYFKIVEGETICKNEQSRGLRKMLNEDNF